MRSMLLILVLLTSQNLFAREVHVKGYTKTDGTYVDSYTRTAPDNTINNNWSTQGNTNPYTGIVGTVPQNSYQPTYGSGNSTFGSGAKSIFDRD